MKYAKTSSGCLQYSPNVSKICTTIMLRAYVQRPPRLAPNASVSYLNHAFNSIKERLNRSSCPILLAYFSNITIDFIGFPIESEKHVISTVTLFETNRTTPIVFPFTNSRLLILDIFFEASSITLEHILEYHLCLFSKTRRSISEHGR